MMPNIVDMTCPLKNWSSERVRDWKGQEKVDTEIRF
jgi:hypothetical protein